MSMADWPSIELQVAMPPEHYASGRLLVSQHVLGQTPIVAATVHGYPSGPTYPNAAQLTDELLKPITEEVVLGRRGPRAILGDFNHSIDALFQTQIWLQCGWVEVQCMALARWQQEIQPTCKGRTVRDFVWLSPEAAAMCTSVSVMDTFAEHSTVIAHLCVPEMTAPCLTWPLPGELPWDRVDVDALWGAEHVAVEIRDDSSDWFLQWAKAFEGSIDGHVDSPGRRLPGCAFGRGRRRAPARQQLPVVSVKPARHGEETCCSHLLSQEVNRWYRQLRRLQSLCHAIRANKQTPAAQAYREQGFSLACPRFPS